MKPNYITWLLNDHKNGKIKILLSATGIFALVYFHNSMKEELNYGLAPLAYYMFHLILIGFSVGMAYQPYNIYKKLERMKWWERDEKDRSKFK